MNKGRFQAIYNGLTSVAQKVYDAIPIGDVWTESQVQNELFRSGRNIDGRIVSGCLNTLADAGLILEKPAGLFCRKPIREKAAARLTTENEFQQPQPKNHEDKLKAPQPASSPIEKLSALSSRVTKMMDGLKSLAADIETAALEIEEQVAAASEDSKKLRQLQDLLKSA